MVNSCLDLFSAAPSLERPLSLGYGANLPSSLTVTHSSASVFSTRPRVSVYGTGADGIRLAVFLGSMLTSMSPRASARRTIGSRLGGRACLPPSIPTPFNRLFRQPAGLSLLRPRVAPAHSTGMLTRSSIGVATRLSLRARLTLIRLALIRKPWSSGGRVSRPPYRYSYLHLLFRTLQRGSSPHLRRDRNAPLPISSIPRLRQAAYARLLSTPRRSTSELLRTL